MFQLLFDFVESRAVNKDCFLFFTFTLNTLKINEID